ncbi:MAG: rhamnogalacturonan acetylesterase [Draconibacterium sp.]
MKPDRLAIAFTLLLTFSLIFGCGEKKPVNIFSIGDSTMATKKPEVYPETGWCQALPEFFEANVTVHNHAVNGRSSKSFIDEGRWQVVLDSLQNGDYLFIQFGHNDEKDYDSTRYTTPFGTYSENLERFVNEARIKGAEPVLFTSIVRRKFGENGKLVDTHGEYLVATRKVAEKLNVPLVDLQKLTEKWVNELGDEASKKMYLWTEPDEKFPEGRKDDTHLSVEGAQNVARLAMEECRRQKLGFAKYLKIN